MLVKNIYWIVVEDATSKTALVGELLKKTGLKYEHLIGKTIKNSRHILIFF